ncbi:MAG: exo-alpha-sialidase [Deltaproteobacteria bacterium]|nr:exo-alpha-sialidase [Deltaproteobacteria bacterium]
MSARPILYLLALAACDPGAQQGDLVSSDQRVDMAGPDDEKDASGTEMCNTPAGYVYVVWSDDRDGTPAVWLNRSTDAGRSWMPAAVQVSHGQGAAVNPDVACVNDSVYVVWEDDRDGELENHNIYYNVSADRGQTWSAQDVALDDDEDGKAMSLGPQIAAAGTQVHIAWYDAVNGAYDILVASSTDQGLSFAAPVRVDSDVAGEAYSASPQIAIDGMSHVYVAWEDSRRGLSDVYFAVSADAGRTYSQDKRLDGGDDAGSHNSFAPRLAAADGQVYVVWHDERNGAGRDVFLNWSGDHGVSWQGEATRVDSDGAGFFDSLYPDLAIGAGVAHIAWEDARSAGYDIYYRRVVDGVPDAPEVRLDTDGAGFGQSLHPKVAVGEANLVVAWQDRRDDAGGYGYNDLYYNFSEDMGLTWSRDDLRVDNIEEGTSYAVELNVGLHRGELLAAWTDGRRGNADVYFHHLQVGEAASYVVAGE